MLWLGAIEFRWSVMGPVARRHFRSAKWMVVSEPIEWASEYVFIFATGTLLGPVAVGALRASQNIAGMTSILFLGLLNVVPSKASAHFHTGGLQAMNRYLRRITLAGTPVTAGICLVIAASPDFWLGLLFGSEFVGYGELVRWWALFYTINFFVLPLRSGLRALERTRPVFVARLGSAAFAVLTAGVLISSFELRGAVIGLLATKVITVGLLGWLFRATQRELAAGDLKLSAAGS
jgi:O-antigen/teichoic acid export membrane protein